MKKAFVFVLAFFMLNITNAQQVDTAQINIAKLNLQQSAKKMSAFFLAKDYANNIKYTHPIIIKLAGGSNKLTALLTKTMANMEAEGYTITNIDFEEPSAILLSGTEYQSVLPQIITMKTEKGLLIAKSYLIAFSNNKGKSWTFADTSNKNFATMKAMFPTLNNKLIIPERLPPQLIKE